MKFSKINSYVLLAFASVIITLGCNKPEHPALGDYPKDVNPPGGPLKFYAALDGSAVDSIRANFGIITDATFGTGVSGQAAQVDVSKRGFISFPSANDFGASTDFTVSLWINATLAEKDHNNAAGVLAFGNSKNFWGNVTIFVEHENSTSDSMPLKIHFNAAGNGDNWQAAGYTDSKRLPSMYDGKWHNIVITYQATESAYVLYRDGVQFDKMIMSPGIKFENASQLIIGGYQEAAGIVDTYANNTWMAAFGGMIDQVRLYGTALSASDVAAIYNNRQ